MLIGQLSKQTSVSVRALRHYDSLGLLVACRTSNRYRSFNENDIQRVRLIQLFLGLGYSLAEIRSYAPCWQKGRSPVIEGVLDTEAATFLRRKLADLDRQIKDLVEIRSQLADRLATLQPRQKDQADRSVRKGE